jgi:thymidylate synthase (FAD)
MDDNFQVEVISKVPNPQQVIYVAMHQDYSESFVWDNQYIRIGDSVYEKDDDTAGMWPEESQAGEVVVRNLLKGGRGHFGPLEHPQIILNCGHFPHSTMQQIRTHRVGLSFDVQSFRYTGQRISDTVTAYHRLLETSSDGEYDILDQTVGKLFYLRPLGEYTDRNGSKYIYRYKDRYEDLQDCLHAARKYQDRVAMGFSEEHARGLIPFDVRQHWVLSANVRSLMHLLDLRWKADAQLEARHLCELIWPHFKAWVPEIASWYETNRLHKARLSP